MWHDTGSGASELPSGGWLEPGRHAESPSTKRRLKNLLDASGLTDGLVVLDPGNLYRVIKRLLAEGLIAESDRQTDDGGERRKYYRLTPLGGRVFAMELDRLRHLVTATSTRRVVKRWTS